MDHLAFISYAFEDIAVAEKLCQNLESNGVKCWIAPRNILPGNNYQEAIIHAIGECNVFVLVLSTDSNASQHVKSEVTTAFNKNKTIIPFKIDQVDLSSSMEYLISCSQWIEAFTGSLDEHMNLLSQSILNSSQGSPNRISNKSSITEAGPKSQQGSATHMDYLPEDPPDVSEFIDRIEILTSLQKSLEKNVIIIQGLAGIGKTHLVAKLYSLLEADHVTYWKGIHSFETFDTLTWDIAGFLSSKEDSRLAEYLSQGSRERERIVKIILQSLENKKFVLFFDNYHVVEDPEIHMLFERLKRNLRGSSVVVASRTPPPFVRTADHIKDAVSQEELDGFDLPATKEFFKLRGLDLDESKLRLLHSRVNGHPFLLLMVSNLADLEEFEDIVEGIPEERIDQYLYDEIFRRLSDREQDILKGMSVFRRSFTADMCVQVCNTENVKNTIRYLEEKLLVKRKGKTYSLHNLIKDFSYAQIDNPKEYHKRAYGALVTFEPTAETIIETTYHYLQVNGALDEEILQYFANCPSNSLNDLTILDLLQENEVISPVFFELMEKRFKSSNNEIRNFALQIVATKKDIDINAAFEFFEKEVERRRGSSVRSENNDRVISNLNYFIKDDPDRVLAIIEDIERSATPEELITLIWLFKDERLKSKIGEIILKNFISSQEGRISATSKNVAANILKNWGLLEGLEISDHLSSLRVMDSVAALQYLDDLIFGEGQFNRFNINNIFLLTVLEELLKLRPEEAGALIIRMIAKSFGIVDIAIPTSTILFNRYGLNREIVEELLNHKSFNVRVTGLFTLLQSIVLLDYFKIRYGITDERYDALNARSRYEAVQILERVRRNDDKLLSVCAEVLLDEVNTPSEPEKRKKMNVVLGGVAKGALKFIKPDLMSEYLLSVDPGDEDRSFFMLSVIGLLSLTNIHTKKLFPILSAGNADSEATRLMISFFCDKIRSAPEELLPVIKKFGFENKWHIRRYGAILWSSVPLVTVPEATIQLYTEALQSPEFDDPNLRNTMQSSLAFLKKWMLIISEYKTQNTAEVQAVIAMIDAMNQNLLCDKHDEVRAVADLLINGIVFDA